MSIQELFNQIQNLSYDNISDLNTKSLNYVEEFLTQIRGICFNSFQIEDDGTKNFCFNELQLKLNMAKQNISDILMQLGIDINEDYSAKIDELIIRKKQIGKEFVGTNAVGLLAGLFNPILAIPFAVVSSARLFTSGDYSEDDLIKLKVIVNNLLATIEGVEQLVKQSQSGPTRGYIRNNY